MPNKDSSKQSIIQHPQLLFATLAGWHWCWAWHEWIRWVKGGEGFQLIGACWGSWDGGGGDQGGAWVVRVGNAISLSQSAPQISSNEIHPSNEQFTNLGSDFKWSCFLTFPTLPSACRYRWQWEYGRWWRGAWTTWGWGGEIRETREKGERVEGFQGYKWFAWSLAVWGLAASAAVLAVLAFLMEGNWRGLERGIMEAIFLLGSAHGGVQRPLRPLSGFHQPWSTPVQAGHPPPLCVLEFATNSGHSVRTPPLFGVTLSLVI